MIYDCFSFNNELDLLDIRLHELSDVVDRFVLVEATKTHSGLDKPLYYEENKHLFSEFKDRITHVMVFDMPMTEDEIHHSLSSKDRQWIESKYQVEDSWVRERYQRNKMMAGLEMCSPDDIIIISDADEIVKPWIIENIRRDGICNGSNAVEQSLNSYYLNVVCTNMPWWGSKIIHRKHLDYLTPSEVRFHTTAACCIRDGGWHFNYLGGADAIKNKIQSFAHQEFNNPDVLENVDGQLKNLKDVLGRKYEYKAVPLDETFPRYVLENKEKFKSLIYETDNDCY